MTVRRTGRLGGPGGQLRMAGLGFALLALAGCQTFGKSRVEDELARVRAERGFAVVASAPGRAVIAARGQRVVVEPPEGFCLDEKSLEAKRRSVFGVVTECMDGDRFEVAQQSDAGEVVEIDLPQGFPGIMTLSISGEPGFGAEPGALDAFEALLGSETGRMLLSRGNNGAAGRIVETRRIGGALYVLVEEEPDRAGFFAPRFWRGFIDVNERLVLVTVSGFSDGPADEDGMLAFLASQLAELRRGNGMAAEAEEARIAAGLDAQMAAAPVVATEAAPAAEAVVAAAGPAPARAPTPPVRGQVAAVAPRAEPQAARTPVPPPRGAPARAVPEAAQGTAPAARPDAGGGAAPMRAPLAPARPG